MKSIYLSAALLILATTSCKNVEDKAIDPAISVSDTMVTANEETPGAPLDSVAMQKAWKNYMTPGDAHKMLANDNGKWDEVMTMWMSPEDSTPTVSKMTAESKMILGGRYQEMRHKGEFMGMPFEGIGTMAFDNASKKIVSTWIDNMGTGMMYMSGPYDGKSNTIELKGEMTDPVTGKIKPCREVYTVVDDNSRKVEMYDVTPEGKEYKVMQIALSRKK